MRLKTQRLSQPSNRLRTHPSSFVIYIFASKAHYSNIVAQLMFIHSVRPLQVLFQGLTRTQHFTSPPGQLPLKFKVLTLSCPATRFILPFAAFYHFPRFELSLCLCHYYMAKPIPKFRYGVIPILQ